MKKFIFVLLVSLLTSVAAAAQTGAKKPGKQVFRANKDQIVMAQKMLKVPDTGKVDPATRDALKTFQTDKGIAATGEFNRATLQKLGIGLTTAQREIPEEPETTEATNVEIVTSEPTKNPKPKKTIFRASKDQIIQAQKMLKENEYYKGAENGALDAATRAGLKKYQAANDLLATGTLDKETLEKMGIELTEQQKESQ